MKLTATILTLLLCLLFQIPVGFAQSGIITTYVGPSFSAEGTLDAVKSLVPDGLGGFYFTSESQNRVLKVTAAGVVIAIAGSGTRGFGGDGGPALAALLSSPRGIALDAAGNLYFSDLSNHRVRKITASGVITTIAGNGTAGFAGDNGPATSAQLNRPEGLAIDSAGNIFIADSANNRIRKVSSPGGVITTVAGNGNPAFFGEGVAAISASFFVPTDVALDAAENLFIADGGNMRVRKVTYPAGVITTVAGTGSIGYTGDGGLATAAQLANPLSIDVDAGGSLFIADRLNHVIRRVSGGIITTIAGLGTMGLAGDGGPATLAKFNQPDGIGVDQAGNIFVVDSANNRVRQFSLGGIINSVVGRPVSGFSGDGGPASAAAINSPQAVAMDTAGNLFIADMGNSRIRKVTSGGIISTVAGNGTIGFNGDGITATSAWVGVPTGIAVDASGNLYISDRNIGRVRKVTNGVITTVAGNGSFGGYGNGNGGAATSAALGFVAGLALDASGNLFIADRGTHSIRKVSSQGVISTVAGNGSFGYSGDGGPALSAALNDPAGIAVDSIGNLYIADTGNNRIRKVNTNGTISTIAGSGTFVIGVDGGPATAVGLGLPTGISVDAFGNVFFADNGLVRKISLDGMISTIAGDRTSGYGGDGGASISARVNRAQGVVVDSSGTLYIADTFNHRIRKVSSGARRDFNSDGRTDILWRNTAGDVSMWQMNGYANTNRFISGNGPGWIVGGTGDFDADGKADILWRDNAGNAAIWLMNGATVSSFAPIGNLPTSWAIAGVADFNADGRADILWRNASGDVAVWLMNGVAVTNSGTFIANRPPSWTIAGTGDFDGDGKADVLWRDTSGDVSLWIMNGITITSNTTIANIWSGWTIVGVADFNGNGRADILWREVTGNVAMWLMNGTTVVNWSLIANIWNGWSIVGTGDFNGNGESDILWRDDAGGIAIWMMDGAVVSSFGSMGTVTDRLPQ